MPRDTMDSRSERGEGRRRDAGVKAWDVPTRAFHWTLVALIAGAYLTRFYGDDDLFWHRLNGYAVLILVLFRIIWGFVGGSTARFSAFASWPWTAARYALDFARRRPRHFLGHNPLGGWVIFAMLGLLAFQAGSGLLSNGDEDALGAGPLRRLVSDETSNDITALHIDSFYLLLALIGLHVSANILYLFWKKEDLVTPMLTGLKRPDAFEDQPEARFGSPWLALVCLLAAAAVLVAAIKLAGGNIF